MGNELQDKIVAAQVEKEVSAQMRPLLSHIGQEIGKGISDAMNAHTPKKVPFGRYRPNNYYHPDPAKAQYFRLGRRYFQCGFMLSDTNTPDAEVALLNQITHSGTYIDGNVIVTVEGTKDEESVSLTWPCSTADIRSEMKDKFRNFKECLELVVAAQEVERKEMAESRSARR